MRRSTTMPLSFPPFTPAVKQLLIANGGVFLLVACVNAFTTSGAEAWVDFHFGLVPQLAILHGWIWQLLTYSFIHAGIFHILFNLLALWMFGAQLETDWGYSLFLQFYFFCVIGAAATTSIVAFTGLLGASPLVPTVGASGGIYGILVAFGVLHGDSEVMLFPIPFMIKARYFVIGLMVLALYGALSSAHTLGQSTAYMAHLGGGLFGYLFLKFVPRRGFAFLTSQRLYGIRNWYYRWKRKRAARKFEVYMRKHNREDYRHEDYFDENGKMRDPSVRDRQKKNGDARPPWVN
jgi:membrane associated rhomboid family serine protease